MSITEREKELARAAVIYAQANLGDMIEAFCKDEDDGQDAEDIRQISVNGDVIDKPTEDEMDRLLMLLQ